jgi:hypothetical protein
MRAGSKGQCQRQELADRVVCDGDGRVVPQHCSRAPVAELGDDFRESTEEAIARVVTPASAASPRTVSASVPPRRMIAPATRNRRPVFRHCAGGSAHARQSIATVLRYSDTKHGRVVDPVDPLRS